MYTDYIANKEYRAGIYVRLSQEDRDKKYESESESVINQRELLKSYCTTNGYTLVEEYVDDGYSGTNFDRPDFKRMISDINQKKINLVIVKDLSRLGRDHIMTGYYIETFFPENQVRFISIMESYDSAKIQASNDASTFIIACNDYYSRQNSIKIRSILDEKRKNGKFVGSKPCYGYKRDPEDKGHLIIDPEVAKYVKMIFDLRDNDVGVSDIATRLTEIGAPTPSEYKGTASSSRLIHRNQWTISSIKKILCNRMYTGDLVQHTQTNLSYKSKKKITLDSSLWYIVENTHESIVDKEEFKRVNDKRRRNTKSVKTKIRDRRLLEGLLYCKECGNRLGVSYRKNHDYWTVNCNKYARDPIRRLCSGHFFPYDLLEEQILRKISMATLDAFSKLDIEELNRIIKESLIKEKIPLPKNNLNRLIRDKENMERKIRTLYEDRLNGTITIESFKVLSQPYEKKINELKSQIDSYTEEDIKEIEDPSKKNYKNQIKKLLSINKNRELLFAIIEMITIDNDRNIKIKFKYDMFEQIEFQYEKKQKICN